MQFHLDIDEPYFRELGEQTDLAERVVEKWDAIMVDVDKLRGMEPNDEDLI